MKKTTFFRIVFLVILCFSVSNQTGYSLDNKRMLYPVIKNLSGKWGYIDATGKLVIEYIYDDAGFFEDGFAAIRLQGKGGFIDLTGKTYFNKDFSDRDPNFHEGLAVYQKAERYGYKNKSGIIVIKPQFRYAHDFNEGLALVVNDDFKCGFINKTGKLVIPYKFTYEEEFTHYYQGFNDGRAAVLYNDKYGYINNQGEFVIKPQYKAAQRFTEGLAGVYINEKWGYIDPKGEYVIKPKFSRCSSFNNGYAFVSTIPYNSSLNLKNDLYKIIDKSGEFVFSQEFFYQQGGGYTFAMQWSVGFVDSNIARVVIIKNDALKYVYIDKSGKIIWEMK